MALDHGIRPSLSVDVETNMAADMFTVMRSTYTLHRTLINERALAGEKNIPPLLTCRDVLEMATIHGARVSHLDHKVLIDRDTVSEAKPRNPGLLLPPIMGRIVRPANSLANMNH